MLGAAYENGIRYFDTAPAYADSEGYLGRFWAQDPARKTQVFQTSKSARRDAQNASADLSRTLSRLGRDNIDLWQIHDVRDRNDIRTIEGPGGALTAFYQARETGTARGIGVTGHHDPSILFHAVTSWDIDSVLLPVNPVEAVIGGFLDRVIPAARERGIGVIGMKTLGAGNYILPGSGPRPESLIRYALSQDVDVVIVGGDPNNCPPPPPRWSGRRSRRPATSIRSRWSRTTATRCPSTCRSTTGSPPRTRRS